MARISDSRLFPFVRVGRARAEWLLARPFALRVAAIIVVGLLFVGRRPSSLLHPQLWAEDGEVFYQQELLHGSARSIFEPYAGYLNLIPRLTSTFAAHVPASVVPLIFAVVSFSIAVWACSLFSAKAYRPIVTSDALRFCACCSFATVPPGHELVGILTNLHWYLSLLVFLLMIRSVGSETIPLRAHLYGVTFTVLAVLSAPETILFFPLAVWKLVRGRTVSERLIPVAVLIGLMIQVAILSVHSVDDSAAKGTLDNLAFPTLTAFVYRVIIASVAGQSSARFLSMHSAYGLVLAIGIGWAIAATLFLIVAPVARIRVLFLIALSFVYIAVAIYARNLSGAFLWFGLIGLDGERYFFLPTIFFILALAIAIENLLRKKTTALKASIFCLLFLGGAVMNFDAGRLTDLHWSSYAPRIDAWITAERRNEPSAELVVPINPPGWILGLPARR